MLKLDDNLLQELGLGTLPEDQKKAMLQHIYETLELRVGTQLANQMSDQQLDEFEQFIDSGGDANQAQALQWLESNLPNYKDVVNQVFEALKGEVKQMAPQIMASAQQPVPQEQVAAPQPAQNQGYQPQQPTLDQNYQMHSQQPQPVFAQPQQPVYQPAQSQVPQQDSTQQPSTIPTPQPQPYQMPQQQQTPLQQPYLPPQQNQTPTYGQPAQTQPTDQIPPQPNV